MIIYSSPLIKGSLGGDKGRNFSLYSLPDDHALFSIVEDEHVFSIKNDNDGSRDLSIINIQDTDSALDARGYLSMRFSNKVGDYKTLVDFDPSGTMTNTPAFTNPSVRRPYVAISGDLKLRGAVRFADGTTLDSAATLATALDFANLSLASSLGTVTSDGSYLAIQVGSTVGKINLQSLSNYVGSGFASVGNNCNLLFSNAEADVSTVENSNSVFIGCDVATEASGWKHSVMIGTEAGFRAVTPNPILDIDTASVFIGYRAGYDADTLENAIFIGTNAGNNADSSSDSIFIGSSAGLNTTSPNSIGIGEHALRGEITPGEGGAKNIEIVAGLLDNQRLMYSSGNLHNRLNIQNTIAGNTDYRNLSVGDAILNPDAPLSVRRDTTIPGHGITSAIQTWYNNDVLEAYVKPSGDYILNSGTTPAWFGNYEGYMIEYIYAPTSYTAPKSGQMRVRGPDFAEGQLIWVTNRDPKLDIHGPGATGGTAFVTTNRINGENRPVYVSCSGA